MFIEELQRHFKKYGIDREITYFENSWFFANSEKYEKMLEQDLDPDKIDEWIYLENALGTAFLYDQAMMIAETLYDKYDIVAAELEHKLRGY